MHFVDTLKLWEENVKERFEDCDAEFRDGELAEEIARMAKERDIDLIIKFQNQKREGHMPKLVARITNEAYGATSRLRGVSSFGNARPKTSLEKTI